MAHPCKHVDRFEISQVSLNDSVAVVQQIERPAEIALVFRTMTPRRAQRLAGCGYYSKIRSKLVGKTQVATSGDYGADEIATNLPRGSGGGVSAQCEAT